MTTVSIGDALFGKTQQAVLGLVFGQPERSFYLREIVSAVGAGISQVQNELARLTAAGLVTREPRGNQVWFRANAHSPVFAELKSLIAKTSGIADLVREALKPFAKQIEAAIIFGSVARGEHDASSDVDLLVVGKVAPSRLAAPLLRIEPRIGRPVNLIVFGGSEMREHLRDKDHFLASVMKQPKIWLVGSEDLIARNDTRARQPHRAKAAQG